nr:hypothetical protein [Mesorhizobium sp. L2C054A000]
MDSSNNFKLKIIRIQKTSSLPEPTAKGVSTTSGQTSADRSNYGNPDAERPLSEPYGDRRSTAPALALSAIAADGNMKMVTTIFA